MVIDFDRPRPNSESPNPTGVIDRPLASPADRLAAFIVDFMLILTPILVALVAPLKRVMYESLINDSHSKFAQALAVGGFIILAVTFFYQTIMNFVYGGTLGKLAFGLRVVDIWQKEKPTWGALSTRTLVFIAEALLLGIPWLAILSHPLRRTIHDRISDTIVITVRQKGARAPTRFESSFVAGIFAAVMAAISLVVLATADRVLDGFLLQDEIMGWMGKDQNRYEQCSDVTAAVGSESDFEVNKRLETSMELFAAGLADQECLRKEADFVLYSSDAPSALAYLAKAFAQSDDADISNEYLAKACKIEPESEACQMTSIVQNWSNEDWKKVADLFAQLPSQSTAHVLVWKLRYFMRQGLSDQALQIIEQLSGRPALSGFLVPERAKALWRSNRLSEARLVATTAYETLSPEDRMSLSGWMCYEELARSCRGHLPGSCERLVQDAHQQTSEELSTVSWLAMTLIKENCKEDVAPKVYDELLSVINSDQLSNLISAVALHSKGQVKEAVEQVSKIVLNSESNEAVRGEALRRLIDWSANREEVNAAIRSWRELSDGAKRNVSGIVYSALRSRGYLSQALDIGWEILNENRANAELNRELVVVAYQLGRRRDAWNLLKSYRERSDLLVNGRTPATVDDFVSITRMLNHEFGQK